MTKRNENAVVPEPAIHAADAGAVAGEIAGAIVGSAAGPAGAVAGMVVGALVGSMAGQTLEDEARRASRHDAELDEAIGVTHGSLGFEHEAEPRRPKG